MQPPFTPLTSSHHPHLELLRDGASEQIAANAKAHVEPLRFPLASGAQPRATWPTVRQQGPVSQQAKGIKCNWPLCMAVERVLAFICSPEGGA